MLDFFGHKSISLIDVWTFVHFLTGCGSVLALRPLARILVHVNHNPIAFLLLASLVWEIIEFYMELGLIGNEATVYWLDGPEHIANRLISDQVALVGGYLFCRNKPIVATIAKIGAVIWLATHIFILPHSMYLHDVWNLHSKI